MILTSILERMSSYLILWNTTDSMYTLHLGRKRSVCLLSLFRGNKKRSVNKDLSLKLNVSPLSQK